LHGVRCGQLVGRAAVGMSHYWVAAQRSRGALLRSFACFCTLLGLTLSAAAAQDEKFLLVRDAIAAADRIDAAGGRAHHVFPPHVLFADAPENSIPQGEVLLSAAGPVDTMRVAGFGPEAAAAAYAWNARFWPALTAVGQGKPLAGDARRKPFSVSQLSSAAVGSAAPLGAGRYETSEFMIGKVAVAIILPESQGALSTENWSASRQNEVVQAIQAAMEWWRQRRPTANLQFLYELKFSIPTQYEPINLAGTQEELWISQVMAYLRYTESDYFEQVYSYVNGLRNRLNTHWAVAFFVVDSLNDADGEFSDADFAYAWLGGPFAVMTYDNDDYGIGGMAPTAAHELAHLFYALDEYSGSDPASERSGYFNALNGNAEDGGQTNVACLMRGQVTPYNQGAVCNFTHLHVGHRDLDSDGIEDILDVPPTGTLIPYSPDPTTSTTLTYSGSGTVSTLPNQNPNSLTQPPPAITLDLIAGAEFQVDGAAWQAAQPSDGAFNSPQESFTFAATLTPGTHTIAARVRDTTQNYQAPPATDTVTVGTGRPAVVSTSPAAGATGVAVTTTVTAAFSANMNPSTINTSTLLLRDSFGNPVAGSVAYSSATRTATFTPSSSLQQAKTYTATMKGGTSGVKDTGGQTMLSDYSWSFTTVVPPGDYTPPVVSIETPSPGQRVSGSVLVRASATDNKGVSKLEFSVNGVVQKTVTVAPYEWTWDTTRFYDGTQTLAATAYDGSGNKATDWRGIVVDNVVFDDVPMFYWAWRQVEAVARANITKGCSGQPPLFCPDNLATRGQMAAFLVRAMGLSPLNPAQPTFADVPASNPFFRYIERLAAEKVTSGCRRDAQTGERFYCPEDPVPREQMAAFLCRAKVKTPLSKNPATFADVPVGNTFQPWVERLADPSSWPAGAVTLGCASGPPRLYCPTDKVSRAQMAVFLTRAFNLPL